MKAIVLCGGLGTRLWPLTRERPKALLPLAGRPALHHILERIAQAGVRDVAIVTGRDPGPFERAAGHGRAWGLAVRYIPQPQPLGIADALARAEAFSAGDEVLACLGDSLSDTDLASVARRRRRAGADAAIALCRRTRGQDFGVAVLDGSWVRSVVEKPAIPPGPWVLSGVYALSPRIFEIVAALTPSARGELEITDAIAALCQVGRVVAYRHYGWWQDVGTIPGLLQAQRRIFRGLRRDVRGPVDPSSTLTGRVVLAPGARLEGCRIAGPCHIGAGAHLKAAEVGPNVTVGRGARLEGVRLEDAVILPGTLLRLPGASLRGVVLGAGSLLS